MNAQNAWDVAYSQLQLQLERHKFDTWLRDAVLLEVDAEGVFVIGVRNTYAVDVLQQRMYRNVRRVLSDVLNAPVELRFEVYRQPTAPTVDKTDDMPLFQLLAQQQALTPPAPETSRQPSMQELVARPRLPDVQESELLARNTFERFVACNGNMMAYQAALSVAENPGRSYNPLTVYSDSGLGKTHLLQAIAHACQSRGLRVIYITSEAFTNDLVESIRGKTTPMFREKYRSADVLLVDDIQFFAGKESSQEEFFHTFNALHSFNKQVVLASDRHPRELKTLEDRLRSRFEGGLVVNLPSLEFETRVAIVRMWEQEEGLRLPYDVVNTIAERAPENARSLLGAFNSVVAKMRLSKQPMTRDYAESLLDNHAAPRVYGRKVEPSDVIAHTTTYYKLKPNDITGKGRTQRVNMARQVAMYLTRELTDLSLPQIGVVFGGRSHSTVLHGCNKVQDMLTADDFITAQIEEIRRNLCGG